MAAKQGVDNAMWGPILEKIFAKAMGNYEATAGGWGAEAFEALLGINTERIKVSNTDDSLFGKLSGYDAKENIMVMATLLRAGGDRTSNTHGLAYSHMYTLFGTYELKKNGQVVARLLHMRNPWSTERYRGPWSDNDSRWTDEFKS